MGGSQLLEPAWGFIHIFKGKFEGSIMHRHKPLRPQITERFNGFIRSHVDVAEGIRKIGANGQQRQFGGANLADFLKAIKISTVTCMINTPPLVFEGKTAVSPMMIPQDASAPMFGRG